MPLRKPEDLKVKRNGSQPLRWVYDLECRRLTGLGKRQRTGDHYTDDSRLRWSSPTMPRKVFWTSECPRCRRPHFFPSFGYPHDSRPRFWTQTLVRDLQCLISEYVCPPIPEPPPMPVSLILVVDNLSFQYPDPGGYYASLHGGPVVYGALYSCFEAANHLVRYLEKEEAHRQQVNELAGWPYV